MFEIRRRNSSSRTKLPLLSAAWLLLANNVLAQEADLNTTFQRIEAELGARLGVSVFDTESNRAWEYNSHERFPLSSTFKTLACANLLQRVDAELESLDRRIVFGDDDLVSYSPVTENRTGSGGMSLRELCSATMSVSDNTAGNLVLQAIGGPEALTQFLRSLGDDLTQLNRWETELNEAVPGDPRDTTTPKAMAGLMEKLVLGDVLSTDSRTQLTAWLMGNAVGAALLRAGIPDDWAIGDKTGAGGYGSRSIAAIIWPPSRKPLITTVYITETEASFDERNAAIAQIGAALTNSVID